MPAAPVTPVKPKVTPRPEPKVKPDPAPGFEPGRWCPKQVEKFSP